MKASELAERTRDEPEVLSRQLNARASREAWSDVLERWRVVLAAAGERGNVRSEG